MHELYVVHFYKLILIVFKKIQASKMQKDEGKKENTRSGKFIDLKGGVEGHGQNRSKWSEILSGTFFQHFITDSPSGWRSVKVGLFWPPLL